MDLLTVARRASLGKNVRSYFKNAHSLLSVGASYSRIVTSSAALDGKEHAFYEATYLIGLAGAAEALLSNLATEYLVCYPGSLSDQIISLDLVDEAGSIAAAIQALAEKTVHDWSYGPFPEFAQKTIELFDATATLDPALMDAISEIMATRDIYVHANGIVAAHRTNVTGVLSPSRQ